jgi:hypothetical protein
MTYTPKAAVCSQIHTKHSTKSEHHVEFVNVKPGGTYRNRKALKGYWDRNCISHAYFVMQTNVYVNEMYIN